MSDYYKILGISRDATQEEIKRVYRKLAHQYHPDRGGDEAKFKEINEAYQVLSNPQKRQQYDAFGKGPFGGGGGFNTQGDFNFGTFDGRNFQFDLGDLFEQFFGGGQRWNTYTRTRVMRGADIQALEHISLEDAWRGVEREIPISWKSSAKKNAVKIKIPAGIHDSMVIRFPGEGEAAPSEGGRAGDLLVRVSVAPHKIFTRRGDDLYVAFSISFTQAALGTTIKVSTLQQEVPLKIPKGIQNGTVLRLSGKGMPHLRGGGHGDEYIKIEVQTPRKLSKKQEELIKKLQEEGI